MSLTADQLVKIAPHCPDPVKTASLLWSEMLPAGIVLVTRAAAFLGQICHECNEWRQMDEYGNSDRYHGRGFIQLTNAANYRAAGEDLGLDLVNHPELAAIPDYAAKIAVWFWTINELSAIADTGDWNKLTRKINGGYNGLAARIEYTNRALAVLGAGVTIA